MVEEGSHLGFGLQVVSEARGDFCLLVRKGERGFDNERTLDLTVEGVNLAFAFNDHAYDGRLNTSCGETRVDFFPEERRYFIAFDSVEDASRLLRHDEVNVDLPVVGKRIGNALGRDFKCGNAVRLFRREFENIVEVPSNGFTLAVGIGSEIDGGGGIGFLLEFSNEFLLVGFDVVDGFKTILEVDTETNALFTALLVVLGIHDVADVTFGRNNFPFPLLAHLGEDGRDFTCFGRRLDDNQFFCHYTLDMFDLRAKVEKKSKDGHLIRLYLGSWEDERKKTQGYQSLMRLRPVISAGCGMPMMWRMLGATSARTPLSVEADLWSWLK